MIDVQNKPVVGHGTRLLGSVPTIQPTFDHRRRGAASPNAASPNAWFVDRVVGLILIVVAPTVFWSAMISGLASWRAIELGSGLLALVATAIAAFLTIIWASLTIERPER
jgi:hypothetical protein